MGSKVVKGEYCGFGEASVYWMLDFVETLMPSSLGSGCSDGYDQSEIDRL